jgi:glucose/arabinose dehydrogenase
VFYPPREPRYVYVAAANQIVRYPYRSGASKATVPAEVIIPDIPNKRHWTRDLEASLDGERLFVSISSASMSPPQCRRRLRRKFKPMKRPMGLAPPGAREPGCRTRIRSGRPNHP